MKRLLWPAATVALAMAVWPGASLVYHGAGETSCARCHEIRPNIEKWTVSTHRNIACDACHGGPFTPDAGFHLNNLNRLVRHVRGEVPEQLTMRTRDIPRLVERCRTCHRQEFAEWQNGPHGAAYRQIFVDARHNQRTRLREDCLRCHGAHYQGGIGDLVTPIDTAGPWNFRDHAAATLPAIPCMSCHEIHREGNPAGRGRAVLRASLAFYDRRDREHVSLARLPMPAILQRERPLRLSPDQRQALCYQCHAPLASRQAGTGDDRTGRGVHEGISCLACHEQHGQRASASCATCHPRLSNCGLDVEKMDTTFLNPKSRHNIHSVECVDCHPRGVPRRPAEGSSIRGSTVANRGE